MCDVLCFRAVTESINQLITLCTQQAPGQKECDNALRELEVLEHAHLVEVLYILYLRDSLGLLWWPYINTINIRSYLALFVAD